jgi:hypothetical protein
VFNTCRCNMMWKYGVWPSGISTKIKYGEGLCSDVDSSAPMIDRDKF